MTVVKQVNSGSSSREVQAQPIGTVAENRQGSRQERRGHRDW